ncbi:NACHT domain-containing protein [Crocosphaera sp.]|uniref:NACHT domain-containing protein n=1 Tax=Crocosphaera sp. TaxID=2729996 RepID=UPI002608A713|nr:NACHT domain-containing protein [Crocosphaera sp.]MDJ0580028.1 NACHT domain-containing protein [Crocosphaera sp.]
MIKQKYLLRLFILTLSLSIFLGSVSSSYSQNPSSNLSSKQMVIKEIKGYAQRHVDNNENMKTEVIIELYKDNTIGLTKVTIAEIYETEYARLKQVKNQDSNSIFSQLPKGLYGWIVAAVLFILLIIRDLIKELLKTSFKNISNWVYQQFSGTAFFEDINLKSYRQALIKKYEKLKIIFRPNYPLDMRTVYVPLKVSGSKEYKSIEVDNALKDYKRLVIKGAPGSGKSMFCRYFCLSYAEGKLNYLLDKPIPILLELHSLKHSNLTVENLEKILVKVCALNDFPKADRFITEGLRKGRIFLLFDGLDEVNISARSSVIEVIKNFLDTYDKCRVIITCRTAVYQNQFFDVVDQTLDIEEFRDKQIRDFLKEWKSQMSPGKSVEQLMEQLRKRPKIMELARNPLLLTMIAYLYTDTPFILPHSRIEFYQKATDTLLELRDQIKNIRNEYEGKNKRRILQSLALYLSNSPQQDRREISYDIIINKLKEVLPSLNLSPSDTNPIIKEICDRSGLLLRIDGGENYKFAHLSLQEYFAAEALRGSELELINKFKIDTVAWREIVKLWCGLATDSTNLIREVYEKDPLAALECLADAQLVDETLANKIIEHFKQELLNQEDTENIAKALAAVAADYRPRGEALLQFLVDIMNEDDNSSHKQAAAKTLSYTNLPKAVYILAEYYHQPHLLQVRQELIRMGDLAVSTLESIAMENCVQAMDDLVAIGTPDAADTLEKFLHNPQLKEEAAYRVAAVLDKLKEDENSSGRL